VRALLVDPDYADTHSNLAGLYSACGRIEDAVRHGCLALVSQPFHPGARKLVAMGYHTLGRLDEAAQIYREWLIEEPDNPLPRHYLAGCTGVDVPVRATDAYVQATFDGFAGSFDAKLAKLTYRAPELIAQAIARCLSDPHQTLDVLDIGCGTGLCGPHLRPYAKTLCGVDLSANMLAKADARGLYDTLIQAELTGFLQQKPGAYDLLACADTLCYFGDLHAAIAGAHGALRPGGLLAFTVEASPDTAPAPFTLHPHGRYSHQREYVQHALAGAGFTRVEMQAEPLRNESGRPVQGWLVTAFQAGGDTALPQR
jgi:predicted TPR repeat methyltransferase